MLKILTVIGARPQIIKAAAISRAVREKYADKVVEKILHTGQHYDENMSAVFFDELGIPQPDYNLGVGSGKHGVQTAKMIAGIEDVLIKERFDGILLYGDTNSTLAGAVAASKLHVPIFHVEAGLRSHNMSMTDSGGVQKEAFFFERPCVILRPETEWVEIVEHGAGIIADADYDRIVNAYNELTGKEVRFPQLFGDGHAAETILKHIVEYLS